MYEKEYQPEIIQTVDKFKWLVELSKANCPDKLMRTAIAIADHIHGVCKVGRCISIPGQTCVDYGWAFPDQGMDLTPINGNNESTTSKKIDELVEQGWLIKVVEKRYGARVKNLFALTTGPVWKAPTKSQTDHLEGKGGKSKKTMIGLAVVNPDNPRLSNSTSGDCQTRQAAVVNLDKVNSNNKQKLETVTVNGNTPASPGHKIKVIDMNILDPEGKRKFGASRRAASVSPSSLTSTYFFDGSILKSIDEAISNSAIVKTDNRESDIETKPIKVGFGSDMEDEVKGEIRKIVEFRSVERKPEQISRRVLQILTVARQLDGTANEIAEEAAKRCGLGPTDFDW